MNPMAKNIIRMSAFPAMAERQMGFAFPASRTAQRTSLQKPIPSAMHGGRAAYSLIEVLIAGAILAIGIAAAALLANSMLVQQEANAQVSSALNLQEQAGKLYRMGLATSEITNVLQTGGLTFSTNASTLSAIESVNCVLVYAVGPEFRTNTNVFVRETNR